MTERNKHKCKIRYTVTSDGEIFSEETEGLFFRDSEACGFSFTAFSERTVFTVVENCAVVWRGETYAAFYPDAPYEFTYQTDYGTIPMRFVTSRFSRAESPERISIQIEYAAFSDETFVANHKIELTATEFSVN
ncbi:MAG: DUF1934 domain-containing protein [Oscillospiraceae bacterium]|nr:DUF1934 domain-containing protein [Oscillospiraceae bacterium]